VREKHIEEKTHYLYHHLSILCLIVLGTIFVGCSHYSTAPVLEDPILVQEENSEDSAVSTEAIPEENESLFALEDDFKYAIVQDDIEYFIIQKSGDGSWNEILRSDYFPIGLAGHHDNRLYFHDYYGLAYIDFNEKNTSRVSWIDYKDPDGRGTKIGRGELIGTTLYFSYNSFPAETEKEEGLRTMELSDTSFNDSKLLISNVQFDWMSDKNDQSLIYSEGFAVHGSELYQYNLSNGEITAIYENVKSFQTYKDGHILYLTDPLFSGKLFLYDINTKNSQLIFDKAKSTYTGSLYAFADYRNGDVYYKDGDDIVKYNNGNRDVIYTYSASHGGEYFYGFTFIRNDTIELILQLAPKRYLIDETTIVDTIPEDRKFCVNMIDGTIRFFDRLHSLV